MASVAQRRRRRVIIMRVACTVAVAAITYFLGRSYPKVLDQIQTKIWAVVTAIPGPQVWVSAHTDLANLMAGALIGLLFSSRAAWVHDRFLAEFDTDLFTPLHVVSDDAIWVAPRHPARQEVWDQLEAWARAGNQKPPRSGWWRRTDARLLSQAFLTGRSGSGKTRTAVVLAKMLAGQASSAGDRETGVAARVGSWLRNEVLFLERKATDPWDVGFLGGDPTQSPSEILSRLRQWRPRRPTFVILDDPSSGEFLEIERALSESCQAWRHPVRWLVVNQSIPSEVGATWRETDQTWVRFGAHVLDPQPIAISDEAWFLPDEIVAVFENELSVASSALHLLRDPESIERVWEVTRGNPLLVTLSVAFLQEGGSVGEMTVQGILRLRAERIFRALTNVGVTSAGALEALAVATLCGGADRLSLEAALGQRDAPTDTVLRAVFPADRSDFSVNIPAFRPALVGEAAVRRFIHETGREARAARIVRAAWGMAPKRLLALRRRSRRGDDPYHKGVPDPLSTALRDIDPREIANVSTMDLILADVEGVLFELDQDRYLGDRISHTLRRCDIFDLREAVSNLTASEAKDLWPELDIVRLRSQHPRSRLRVDAWAAISTAALASRASVSGESADGLLRDLLALLDPLQSQRTRSDEAVMTTAGTSLDIVLQRIGPDVAASDPRLVVLGEALWEARFNETFAALGLEAMARHWPSAPEALYWTFAARALGASEPPAPVTADSPEIEAKILRAAAFGLMKTLDHSLADRCRRYAETIANLAPSPAGETFATAYLEARSAEIYLLAHHPTGEMAFQAEALAKQIGDGLEGGLDRASLRGFEARRLRFAAFAHSMRPDGEGAENVEDLLAMVQAMECDDASWNKPREVAEILRYAVQIRAGQDTASAQLHLDALASLCAEHPDWPTVHENFARSLHAATAHLVASPENAIADDARALELARLALEHAWRWPEHVVIQKGLVQTLLAAARTVKGGAANLGAVDQLVRRAVEASELLLPDDARLLKAEAFAVLASVHATLPSKQGEDEVKSIIMDLTTLLAEVDDVHPARLQLIEAWRWLAFARCNGGHELAGAASEAAARELEALAAAFPQDYSARYNLAEALKAAAFGHRHGGSTPDLNAVGELVEEIRAICADYPNDEYFGSTLKYAETLLLR